MLERASEVVDVGGTTGSSKEATAGAAVNGR